MPVGTYDPGTDHFDLAVNYGGLVYSRYFGGGLDCTPLPRMPLPAGDECRCPSCESEGWYAASPVCRFWRAHCEACDGTRSYVEFLGAGRRHVVTCELCELEWTEAVAVFRRDLRSPRAAAQRLREQARSQLAGSTIP